MGLLIRYSFNSAYSDEHELAILFLGNAPHGPNGIKSRLTVSLLGSFR